MALFLSSLPSPHTPRAGGAPFLDGPLLLSRKMLQLGGLAWLVALASSPAPPCGETETSGVHLHCSLEPRLLFSQQLLPIAYVCSPAQQSPRSRCPEPQPGHARARPNVGSLSQWSSSSHVKICVIILGHLTCTGEGAGTGRSRGLFTVTMETVRAPWEGLRKGWGQEPGSRRGSPSRSNDSRKPFCLASLFRLDLAPWSLKISRPGKKRGHGDLGVYSFIRCRDGCQSLSPSCCDFSGKYGTFSDSAREREQAGLGDRGRSWKAKDCGGIGRSGAVLKVFNGWRQDGGRGPEGPIVTRLEP